MTTPELIRAELVALRERHVRVYTGHLAALASTLTRTTFSENRSYVDARAISRELMEHVGDFEDRIEALRLNLLLVATESGDDETLRNFAHSLADETIESVLSQVRVDTHRARRLATELAMSVLSEAPKNERAYRAIVSNFLGANLHRLDSKGRHVKSERFVRAVLSTAIFRARNESFLYTTAGDSFALHRANHPVVSFNRNDYAEVVGSLHPFAEPIVLVDI